MQHSSGVRHLDTVHKLVTMKLLSLLAVLFVYSVSTHVLGQLPKDLETFDLKGRVQSVRVDRSKFEMVNGKLTEGTYKPWEQTNFDEQGNYTDRIGLENGNTRPFRNKYDSLDRMILRTEEGSSERTLFKYSPGKIETTTELDDGHVLDRNVYVLDDSGRKVSAEYFLIDENLGKRLIDPPDKTLYKYDSKGRLIESSTVKRDGTPAEGPLFGVYRYTNKYDEKGNSVERAAYKLDGTVFNVWTRTFDSSGRLIEVNSTRFSKIVYSDHDAQGNWLKSVTYKRVEKDGKTVYEPLEADYRTIKYY